VPNPDLDTIVNGWFDSLVDGAIIKEMEKWSAQYGKKVIFTELGYCSVDYAA
jgi:hypothetical protein